MRIVTRGYSDNPCPFPILPGPAANNTTGELTR